MRPERRRRLVFVALASLIAVGSALFGVFSQQRDAPPKGSGGAATQSQAQQTQQGPASSGSSGISSLATEALSKLSVKGRAAKTGYARAQFGDGWQDAGSCDVRNRILARDMTEVAFKSETDCTVLSGTLHDPYTNKTIAFMRGTQTSDDVQIDHVVALSDAWQKGAQQLPADKRVAFANDPLNLLAVDGPSNNAKGDADAATWLPPNKDYRCRYVARQIAVKTRYNLWVTQAEHDAMDSVLDGCPGQVLPLVN